ncbi:AMP-binding protein [Sulfuriflexus sp.]|uniref:AMP-binding protein n=1 Tax=Sulfuriflexus sp. TaxID=2015443 RepID=UPI0028CD6339|nr:AMP-binding protein [Sulfuriflexus sp.]MDT8404806.1 AMP-binding protein [Sulfuriflexus sp.]
MEESVPLLFETSDIDTIAFYAGRLIKRNTFLSHVEQTRTILENRKYCINLCENRYHFLVAFAACTSLQQISLLPSSRADKEIERIETSYKDNYRVDDRIIEAICRKSNIKNDTVGNNLHIDSEKEVAIVFTSGSTGRPKANLKTWRQLSESAIRVKERLFNPELQYSVIATVPPQHMYGFETTIIYPLMLGVAIHADRPFYPLDIRKALSEMPSPRVLITTPIHLKACNSDKEKWPDIDFVVSATAVMQEEVAKEAEEVINTQVFEIYGCSEAGAIATRQMTRNPGWCLLRDYKINNKNNESKLASSEKFMGSFRGR